MHRNQLSIFINGRGQLFKPPFSSIFIQPTLNDRLVIVEIPAPFLLDDISEIRVQMAVNVFGMLITQLYRTSLASNVTQLIMFANYGCKDFLD